MASLESASPSAAPNSPFNLSDSFFCKSPFNHSDFDSSFESYKQIKSGKGMIRRTISPIMETCVSPPLSPIKVSHIFFLKFLTLLTAIETRFCSLGL